MNRSTTATTGGQYACPHRSRPRTVAKSLTVVLWAIGSAYLVAGELRAPSPDPTQVWSIPIIWAAVIALPVLAGHALADRHLAAASLLALAALIGSAYTMAATLGRQAEARDLRMASAGFSEAMRGQIERDLAEAKAVHTAALERCGKGRVCSEATQYVVGLAQRDMERHENRLASIRTAAPDAGERRIAEAIVIITGIGEESARRVVASVLPCLMGFLLEIGALACAMYGWSSPAAEPSGISGWFGSSGASDLYGQSDFPAIDAATAAAAAALLKPSEPSGAQRNPERDRVLAALLTDLGLGRSIASQRDLCERFGVPRSTMSDWLREWEASGLIPARQTVGRCKSLIAPKA